MSNSEKCHDVFPYEGPLKSVQWPSNILGKY